MLQDLRFALRLFRKHLLPAGITIAGLALAIGVVSAVFTVVNATMLRPYGMDDPSTVASVNQPMHGRYTSSWRYTRFLQMRRESSLATIEASRSSRVRFTAAAAADGGAVRRAYFVSGGYLSMLGAKPEFGRTLAATDDVPGAPPVVVVSHHVWATDLSADATAIGRIVLVNGVPVTLAGVLSPSFTGPTDFPPAIWAPLAAFDDVLAGPAFTEDSSEEVDVIARLAPGASGLAAQSSLTTIVSRPLNTVAPSATSAQPPTVMLYSAASPMDGPDATESWLTVAFFLGAVGLVLAVACANTASLLMAAATTRAREMGVRLAMGASRRRLVGQMTSESLLLAGIAGVLGFLIAIWIAPLLASVLELPAEIPTTPDWRVLLFTITIALTCGLAAGFAPARHGARGNLVAALQSQAGSGGGATRSRLRTSFIGAQAGVSMLLLVSAMLFARSASSTARSAIGYDADRVLSVSMDMPATNFDERGYSERALAAVRALPSVEHASLIQFNPFGQTQETNRFSPSGRWIGYRDIAPTAYTLFVHRADAELFAAAGMHVLRGRLFTEDEVATGAHVAVVSESVVRQFFDGADALGRLVTDFLQRGNGAVPATIVGVVSDALMAPLYSRGYGSLYLPIDQHRKEAPGLLVRARNAGIAGRAVEDALRRVDSRVRPIATVMRENLDYQRDKSRMLALLAGPAAALTLVLALIGIYGVTAFVVSQRTHEVSVRMAIGATARDILRLLAVGSLRPVAIGLAIGLVVANIVSRSLSGMFAGISPHDPMAIAIACATLAAGALCAVIVPARRAARVDPAGLLR